MNDKVFVDTNIWIYAHLEEQDSRKCALAVAALERSARLVLSTQVLNEYYSVMLKNRAQDDWIQENIESLVEWCEVALITLPVIRLAHRVKLKYRFSYWDSLIVASALDSRCKFLFSEDLQSSQLIEGSLLILNPLQEA
jgi:predicted nucleic acid-binding protein